MEGLTGAIKFDADGLRTNFHLSIVGNFVDIKFILKFIF